MATNTLSTRFKLRYDTLANWTSNNPYLKKGEIAIVEIPAEANAMQHEPCYAMKVGISDTETNDTRFSALPYMTGLAGDIYEWARASTKPTYNATEIMMAASGDEADTSVATKISGLASQVASIIASGGDTNTIYALEFGDGTNGGNPGQVRFGHADGTLATPEWTYGNWTTVGVTVAAGNNGVTVTTANGTASVSAKLSGKDDNLLSIENDDNNTNSIDEAGLYVPKATVSGYTTTQTSGEVDVLTGIATSDGHTFTQSVTQLYTKDKIDSLINPSMEFKGVKTATEIGSLTGVKVGDSYKISTGGTVNSSDTVKTGDLVIYVAKGTTPETYEWAIIPSGDESFTDTYREIQVNGTQLLDNALSGGEVNFVDGPGVGITGSGNDISFELDLTEGTGIDITAPSSGSNSVTLAVDVSEIIDTIATTQMTSGNGSGLTLQGQLDTLKGNDSTTGSVAKTVKDAISTAIGNLDATLTAGEDNDHKQKVFTALTETDGAWTATSSVLSITDIDVGDYLILDGGSASSFASQS